MGKSIDDNLSGDDVRDNDRYRSIIEAVQDGIFVVNPDGIITFVNESLCSVVGHTRSELVGEPFETLVASGLVQPDEFERFVTAIEDIADGESRGEALTFEIGQESEQTVEVRVSKHTQTGGTENIVGVVRDVTERERRARSAERKQEALAKLYQVGAESVLTFEQKAERILSVGCDYLDLPYGFLTTIANDTQTIVHSVGDHKFLQPGESAPIEESYCRKTIDSHGLIGIQDAREVFAEGDPAYERFELGCYIGTKVMTGETLYGTFCFAAPNNREVEFTSGEREVVRLLGQWAGYEVERERFEERLQGLHRISQQLLSAETPRGVAEITINEIAELFDLPVSAFWEYDADEDVLRGTIQTDEAARIIGDIPTFDRGDALIWESFDSGELRYYEDLTHRSDVHNPETPLQSEVFIPCGNYGVLSSSATESRAFDEIDIESLRLLTGVVRDAMGSVKREQQLAVRGEKLQRQNERLEEFADTVAHDLRNPLAGAVGALEIARETNEAQFFERAEASLDRMEELIDELLMIARGDRQAANVQPVELQSIAAEAWSYTDTQNGILSVDGTLGEIHADETRLLQLFGNLFRNSMEHAGDDATVEVGLLPDDRGFYVADDGPGFSDDSRAELRALGETDGLAGPGIGLTSVIDVVDAHGWEFTVPETDRGARLEIRTSEQTE